MQAQQLEATVSARLDGFAQQLQSVVQALGMPISGSQATDSVDTSVSPVVQQLHDLHAAVALLAQAQQQATPQHEAQSVQDKWQQDCRQLQTDVQQLQASGSSLEHSTANLQQSLAAQQAVNADLQQQYQQVLTEMQNLKAQHGEEAQRAQHAHDQLAAQVSSFSDGLTHQLQDQCAQLDNLNAVAAQHGEQLQSQANDLSQHGEQLQTQASNVEQHTEQLQTQASHVAQHTDQLQTQASHVAQHTEQLESQAEQMAQHAEQLQAQTGNLRLHGEQVQSQAVQLVQHGEQLQSLSDNVAKLHQHKEVSGRAQTELQEVVHKVEPADQAAPSSIAQHTQHAEQTERVQERLASLETEQAHSAAANEAMSGIIDQVPASRSTHAIMDLSQDLRHLVARGAGALVRVECRHAHMHRAVHRMWSVHIGHHLCNQMCCRLQNIAKHCVTPTLLHCAPASVYAQAPCM